MSTFATEMLARVTGLGLRDSFEIRFLKEMRVAHQLALESFVSWNRLVRDCEISEAPVSGTSSFPAPIHGTSCACDKHRNFRLIRRQARLGAKRQSSSSVVDDNNYLGPVITISDDEDNGDSNAYMPLNKKKKSSQMYEDIRQKGYSCPICYENPFKRLPSVTQCGHVFCKECIHESVGLYKRCPTCNQTADQRSLIRIHL